MRQAEGTGRNWYAIHTYSGYEDAVKEALLQRMESLGMPDLIFDVVVDDIVVNIIIMIITIAIIIIINIIVTIIEILI